MDDRNGAIIKSQKWNSQTKKKKKIGGLLKKTFKEDMIKIANQFLGVLSTERGKIQINFKWM